MSRVEIVLGIERGCILSASVIVLLLRFGTPSFQGLLAEILTILFLFKHVAISVCVASHGFTAPAGVVVVVPQSQPYVSSGIHHGTPAHLGINAGVFFLRYALAVIEIAFIF